MPKSNAIVKADELTATALKNYSHELFERFFDGIQEQGGLTEESKEAIAAYINGKGKEGIVKRDELCDFLAAWKPVVEQLRAEAAARSDKARSIESFIGFMREAIAVQMGAYGVKSVEGFVHRITLVDGKDRVEIYDESLVPSEYLEYTPKVDKNAVARAIAEGKEVPGARLIFSEPYIQIR